jgi:hypothetical protein
MPIMMMIMLGCKDDLRMMIMLGCKDDLRMMKVRNG